MVDGDALDRDRIWDFGIDTCRTTNVSVVDYGKPERKVVSTCWEAIDAFATWETLEDQSP